MFGDLIVDNQDLVSFSGSTPLRSVGSGVSTFVDTNELEDTTASFPVPDAVTGAWATAWLAKRSATGWSSKWSRAIGVRVRGLFSPPARSR